MRSLKKQLLLLIFSSMTSPHYNTHYHKFRCLWASWYTSNKRFVGQVSTRLSLVATTQTEKGSICTPIPTSHTQAHMQHTLSHTQTRDPHTGCRSGKGWGTGGLAPLDPWGGKTPTCGGTNTLSIGRRVQYMQEPVLSTDTITHAHVHRSTYILALCLVRIIILISKWKWGLSTRLHPHPDTNTPISMHIYNIYTQTCVRWDPGGPISTGCWKEEGWGTGGLAPLNTWGGKTLTCGGTYRDHWEEGRFRQDQTNIGNHK